MSSIINKEEPYSKCEQMMIKNDDEETTTKVQIIPLKLNSDGNRKNSTSLSASTDSDGEAVVVPPDGGWGWMIVFASFMSNMIVDGIIFSFGMFLSDISKSFNVNKSQVSLIGSLMSGFYLIVGPFASAIANRYGFRFVAIFGSILGAGAFVLSYFATSVEFLCVSYGILGGIGFGFIYVPAVIAVGYYFEKWRALATGIGVCGSGIGTFLFVPLTSHLIDLFGWKIALLCQGAIVGSCTTFGLLYRPLKPIKLKDINKLNDPTLPEIEEEELNADIDKLPPNTRKKMEEALKLMKKSNTEVDNNIHSIPRLLGPNNNSFYPTLADVYHTINVPQASQNRRNIYEISSNISQINQLEKRSSVPSHINESKKPLLKAFTEKSFRNRTKSEVSPYGPQHHHHSTIEVINRPLYRDDIFFNGSLARLSEYTSRNSLGYNLSVTRVPTKNDVEEEKKHVWKLFPEAVKRALSTMLDLSLLKSATFLILAFGGFLTMMGFYVPFMFLADRASQSDIDSDLTVWLVSSIGIANTIGRVLCGLLSSFPGVNALFVTNVALTIGGLATMLSGWSMTVEYQFFYSIVFGLSISCFASLRPIIVVDLLGLENLTNAFGLLLMFQGIAACIGSPLAGAFMDWMGNYDGAFYLSGGLLLSSAIMCYPLNWINKIEMGKKLRKDDVEK